MQAKCVEKLLFGKIVVGSKVNNTKYPLSLSLELGEVGKCSCNSVYHLLIAKLSKILKIKTYEVNQELIVLQVEMKRNSERPKSW